ncbi:hypothetical protein C671_2340 [[Clostridium] bifermentans ATCC 19299]|nr:hypothetical protein C671_2340 [[Clostridium] bifermentans ATCC 19299] [Paraclostridium bifermentans ATCC 19299]
MYGNIKEYIDNLPKYKLKYKLAILFLKILRQEIYIEFLSY